MKKNQGLTSLVLVGASLLIRTVCQALPHLTGITVYRLNAFPNWNNVTSGIGDDGFTRWLLVDPPSGHRLYRLFKS